MHIQSFYRKFTSNDERGNLFQALRNLSLADDLKSIFSDTFNAEWVNWPPAGVDAVCEA